MFTHNFDPVIFSIGFVDIRWYSLAYIFGILIGWSYGKKIISSKLTSTEELVNSKEFDDLITYLILSIIIGGRLGYVIFYNLNYYISSPIEIFKIWEGGMSFHGALIGIIFGTYFFTNRNKKKTLYLLDVVACVSPIGIFLGRIANFINGELIGKTTNIIWGVIFPNIDNFPRHPSQIYEAILEGLALFIILNVRFFNKNYKTGHCSCLFLIFYGVFRIFSEIFREPDSHIGYILNLFSMGTILSFFMIVAGIFLFNFLKKNEIKFKIF